jgi:putative DNA primase/helicase
VTTRERYAELGAQYDVSENGRDPLEALKALPVGSDALEVAAALDEWRSLLPVANALQLAAERNRAVKLLGKAKKIDGAARMVDAALPRRGTEANPVTDLAPADAPQDGVVLLSDLADWFRRYVWFPIAEAGDAVAAWAILTWFAAHVYFAPLLIVASPTKGAGKTTFLDLLRHVVFRGHLTSAYGATGPVIFRLNEAKHPTFLLDEAERLGGRDADRDVVNLLNAGHRRGGKVDRCKEKPGGGFEVEEFDAFGFRALALIGKPWDTVLDRGAPVVRLERAPRDAKLARFAARHVEREGRELARRVARWAADHGERIADAEEGAPRPPWLTARGCDNWAPLFAVGALVGGEWPAKLEAAAQALQGAIEDDGDRGERLVRDLGRIFTTRGQPEVIPSGELSEALNQLEEATWAEERRGKGISTHRLASLLRPFKLRPKAARDAIGRMVRGYWWTDLAPVVRRYEAPDARPGPSTSPANCFKGGNDPAKSLWANAETVATVETIDGGGMESAEDPDEALRAALREGA